MTQTKSRTQDCCDVLQHKELLNACKYVTLAQLSVLRYNHILDSNESFSRKSTPADDQERQIGVPLGQRNDRFTDGYVIRLKLELSSQIKTWIHLFEKTDLALLAQSRATCSEFGIIVTFEEV